MNPFFSSHGLHRKEDKALLPLVATSLGEILNSKLAEDGWVMPRYFELDAPRFYVL